MHKSLKRTLIAGTAIATLTTAAAAEQFNIPAGDLKTALDVYARQTGTQLLVSTDAVKGIHTRGVQGDMGADAALSHLLSGTGFKSINTAPGTVGLVPAGASSQSVTVHPLELAQATPSRAAVETVTVTSSKLGGADVQSIPIAITALSQEQLTATQTAGGPDLIKQVPNMTFTKTNFTGYSIQIRGIGTQAISVTTDPAVAVAFNDVPFIRNHFFEQEFFDVNQVAVLRGPQGTLYGRNATAGVVDLTSARPTDQFEAMASGEIGNYHQRRFEGMINLPIVDDRLDIRLAGEWTKRQGYSFNELQNRRIDGRDLWSGRATIGWKPVADLQTYLIWEHFSEDDDRIRSSKQLCKTDPIPTEVGGFSVGGEGNIFAGANYLSQGCQPVSMYSREAFQVPNGFSLPYYQPLTNISVPIIGGINPYASTTQSTNLRVIESANDPRYKAKNDIVMLDATYTVNPSLTFVSQTGFSHDFLWGTQDYNRFNTQPGIFMPSDPNAEWQVDRSVVSPDGFFCDPQLGCSNRLVAQDLSTEHAWQLSQEFRLSSHLSGPFNFSIGGNYLHYETFEKYYVFINTLSLYAATSPRLNATLGGPTDKPYFPGVTDNIECFNNNVPRYGDPSTGGGLYGCIYMDPNPIDKLNDKGHNYFLSQNPYVLNSYATFGEAYYDLTSDLKLIGGLRWTDDRKHFSQIPSWLVVPNTWGYPIVGAVNQHWGELTGRASANWTPKLDFTDQTLIYASFAHGYKAGGANPPGAIFIDGNPTPAHPLTFEPEFINAFEGGTKNTLLDGAITLNASAFYYKYKNYQISEIIDRTSINLNFDATVKGAELEAVWEPIPGLRFNFNGGWEKTRVADGEKAIDLMDRTAGNPDWIVVKPFVDTASNCVLPIYVIATLIEVNGGYQINDACNQSYRLGNDPLTNKPFTPYPGTANWGDAPIPNYPGFNPVDPNATNNGAGPAPNNGAGFYKDLSGNELPNAPQFTTSVGAQYSMPLSSDWAGTLRSDFYWQDASWARIINADPYDRIHGYTNLNLTLIFTNQNGWQVMLYDKNVFNTTAITGTFLNSDDSGLTTNVFLTDPKLIGIRVTKNW